MARAARLAASEVRAGADTKGDIPEELEVSSQYWIINRGKGQCVSVDRWDIHSEVL
jgi:hypothetical protein